jgi:hypothetical protein
VAIEADSVGVMIFQAADVAYQLADEPGDAFVYRIGAVVNEGCGAHLAGLA